MAVAGARVITAADRALVEATVDALGLEDLALRESAKTAMLSRTHAPIGKGGRNWITASKPGNRGQLPAYIQNVRNAIMRDGTPESDATGIAIGRVRDWSEGKGNVSPEVRAAAAKAIAEFDAMRGKSKAKNSIKEAAPMGTLATELTAEEIGDLSLLEAKPDDKDAPTMPSVYCVADRKKVTPTKDKKCPDCGADLSKAVATAMKKD